MGAPTHPGDLVAQIFFAEGHTLDSKAVDNLTSRVEDAATKHFGAREVIQTAKAHSLDGNRVLQVELRTSGEDLTLADATKLSQSDEMRTLEREYDCEFVIQPAKLQVLHKKSGLAVFDMDSTLIQQEVIDELARAIGKYEQVAAITEAAMRGEAPYTDFEASLRARVALLKGVNTTIWQELKAGTITFTPGARELVQALRKLGWKTAVLSGGFTPLANWVKESLGLDYASANHLVNGVDDRGMDVLTGELVADAPIVHAQRKQDLLLQLAADYAVPVERTIAVGDGSNDLLMMAAAGTGIAFNAKPKVQQAAPCRLNSRSLVDVMHVLGYDRHTVDSLLAQP